MKKMSLYIAKFPARGMMIIIVIAAVCSALLNTAAIARAGDAEVGKVMAAPCAACHGENGAKPISNYPILAGQDEKYLLYTMRAYKNGQRNNAIMAAQMAELSQTDLANLAAYFAAQESPLR